MKKIIDSLFHLISPEPDNIEESEKTPFWQKVIFLMVLVGICIILYFGGA